MSNYQHQYPMPLPTSHEFFYRQHRQNCPNYRHPHYHQNPRQVESQYHLVELQPVTLAALVNLLQSELTQYRYPCRYQSYPFQQWHVHLESASPVPRKALAYYFASLMPRPYRLTSRLRVESRVVDGAYPNQNA